MKAIATFALFASIGFLVLISGCRKCDPCADVVCHNGGKCIEGKCKCPDGWTGPDCSEPVKRQ